MELTKNMQNGQSWNISRTWKQPEISLIKNMENMRTYLRKHKMVKSEAYQEHLIKVSIYASQEHRKRSVMELNKNIKNGQS